MPEQEPAVPSVVTLGSGLAPAAAGERGAAAAPRGGATVVHYHLPVEIEVRTVTEAVDLDAVATQALIGLTRGLANT